MGYLSGLWKNWGKSENTLPPKSAKKAATKVVKKTVKKSKKTAKKKYWQRHKEMEMLIQVQE